MKGKTMNIEKYLRTGRWTVCLWISIGAALSFGVSLFTNLIGR